jgi:hypothetical protein
MLHGPFPSGGLARGISDVGLAPGAGAAAGALALERARDAGAQIVRIRADWRAIVAAQPGAGFQPRDPASPSYDFARLDAAVQSAVAAGLTPLLVVARAPAFAEAPLRWHYAYPGSWAPDPAALGDFAAALARRYDGAFMAPGASAPLPRVHLFQAWNEPNLARYLEPQWVARDGRWSAFSPALYGQMLNGFYAGVKSVQPDALVISAGMAPNGDRPGIGRMAPVSFLRAMLCVTVSGHRARGCGEPVHLDALAFHPLSVGDPDVPADSSRSPSTPSRWVIRTYPRTPRWMSRSPMRRR